MPCSWGASGAHCSPNCGSVRLSARDTASGPRLDCGWWGRGRLTVAARALELAGPWQGRPGVLWSAPSPGPDPGPCCRAQTPQSCLGPGPALALPPVSPSCLPAEGQHWPPSADSRPPDPPSPNPPAGGGAGGGGGEDNAGTLGLVIQVLAAPGAVEGRGPSAEGARGPGPLQGSLPGTGGVGAAAVAGCPPAECGGSPHPAPGPEVSQNPGLPYLGLRGHLRAQPIRAQHSTPASPRLCRPLARSPVGAGPPPCLPPHSSRLPWGASCRECAGGVAACVLGPGGCPARSPSWLTSGARGKPGGLVLRPRAPSSARRPVRPHCRFPPCVSNCP